VMMSKCTTGASPAVECCCRFGRGTDGRWLLLLAVIPLLLLATVVVVQLYNFSTVASSKRVYRYRSRFISKRNRREKKSDDNPIYRNALQNSLKKNKIKRVGPPRGPAPAVGRFV
jgi:hypothetical protein